MPPTAGRWASAKPEGYHALPAWSSKAARPGPWRASVSKSRRRRVLVLYAAGILDDAAAADPRALPALAELPVGYEILACAMRAHGECSAA